MPEVSFPIVPFPVPESVCLRTPPRPRQDGIHPLPLVVLKNLDERTLADLCIEFRKSVFEKAEKAEKEDPDAPHRS